MKKGKDKVQEQRIQKFYKEFLSWSADNIGVWIGAGALEFLMGISCAVPLQEMLSDVDGDSRLMMVMLLALGSIGATLYIRPYVVFTEEKKSVSILEKVKFLPIDIGEIRRYRTKKMLFFLLKLFPVFLALQCATTYYSYGRITIWNVLYIMLVTVLIPFVLNLLYAIEPRQ